MHTYILRETVRLDVGNQNSLTGSQVELLGKLFRLLSGETPYRKPQTACISLFARFFGSLAGGATVLAHNRIPVRDLDFSGHCFLFSQKTNLEPFPDGHLRNQRDQLITIGDALPIYVSDHVAQSQTGVLSRTSLCHTFDDNTVIGSERAKLHTRLVVLEGDADRTAPHRPGRNDRVVDLAGIVRGYSKADPI